MNPGECIARSLIDDMSALVSPPDVCLKVAEMVGSNTASAEEFGEVIIRDPSFAARILKLVNSPYFGLRTKVGTVSRAVAVIGTNELSNLVYSLCAVKTFSGISSALTNMNTFWRHSVYCALAGGSLAKRANILHPERLFVAGLLHDIGTLIINARLPEIAEKIILSASGDEHALYLAEQEQLGFDHARLGAMMLRNWNLPETTCDAIAWHHEPGRAAAASMESSLVHVGDRLANLSGVGSYCEQVTESGNFDQDALALIGLDVDFDQHELMDEVDRQFVETIYLLVA